MKDVSGAVRMDKPVTSAERFLRAARLCRIRDLEQLSIVSELVKDIGGLIHALQKERGASSIVLGSHGTRFADRLAQRVLECRDLERVVRTRLEHVDERLDRMSSGARFYSRVALALHALDSLAGLRRQIATLALVPQDSVKAFTEIIGHLLAVVFEAADIAAEPAISRALVAFVNFMQAKEFAGQERATAGAAFSRGLVDAGEHRRLVDLIGSQERAFRIFAEFADPAHVSRCHAVLTSPDAVEVERMRKVALTGGRVGELGGITGETWFEQATRRIDAMKTVEDALAADLNRLCADTLAEARVDLTRAAPPGVATLSAATEAGMPVALLVMESDPALAGPGGGDGPGYYTLDGIRPKLMRSVVDLVQAQSRRLQDMSSQLESARTALNERKVIDRAKGLLMTSRGLSEEAAYTLMRKTAMNQNKRIIEVAETVLTMADILKTTADGVG